MWHSSRKRRLCAIRSILALLVDREVQVSADAIAALAKFIDGPFLTEVEVIRPSGMKCILICLQTDMILLITSRSFMFF